MIKKIIACLTICFIITGLISPVFSDASALPQPNWNEPGISEIINISDLTGWMLNGGTYDVSTYTDAESFMNDYYSARTKTRLEGSDYQVKSSFGLEQQYYQVGDSAYAHPLDVNRVISSSFRDHSGYGRRLSNEVNDALLSSGSLYDTKIPLLNEVEFANFVGYNHDALRLYSEFFTSQEGPSPQPPAEYAQYIECMNGTGFDLYRNKYDYSQTGVSGQNQVPRTKITDWSQYTVISSSYQQGLVNRFNTCGVSDILTININSVSENNYTATVSPQISGYTSSMFWHQNTSSSGSYRSNGNTIQSTEVNGEILSWYYKDSSNNTFPFGNELSLTGTLDYILERYCHFVKNVNIYVDGTPWSIVGNVSTPTITPEFPDAVGGEDLPSTTWPVHRPLAPYFITAPGMLQAIQDAIDGDGELDIDDLKPYLTDENGDPVPDPQFDPEPIPIPVPDPVNPDVVPGLPVLPAIPPDMPGFNGVSVLAEIINFTNQSLPTALIVTFWGIVFGIVILGLIKILHK